MPEVSSQTAAKPKSTGGRPPKFAGPSRPVTLTLPERTLRDLTLIHEDRAQAIVKLADAALQPQSTLRPQVEVVEMASNTGIIVVGPSTLLRKIEFLHLVEVAPSRYILALAPGHDYRNLEIAILDSLEEDPQLDEREKDLIANLLDQIRQFRKTERVSMAEILLVKMEKAINKQVTKVMECMAMACTIFA